MTDQAIKKNPNKRNLQATWAGLVLEIANNPKRLIIPLFLIIAVLIILPFFGIDIKQVITGQQKELEAPFDIEGEWKFICNSQKEKSMIWGGTYSISYIQEEYAVVPYVIGNRRWVRKYINNGKSFNDEEIEEGPPFNSVGAGFISDNKVMWRYERQDDNVGGYVLLNVVIKDGEPYILQGTYSHDAQDKVDYGTCKCKRMIYPDDYKW